MRLYISTFNVLIVVSDSSSGFILLLFLQQLIIMSAIRALGRTLYAAARTETSASAAGSSSAIRTVRNPLEEFFEADRTGEDDKPVVYGT